MSSVASSSVPPLQLLSPRRAHQLHDLICSPRTSARYTPRTHREQLELHGEQLSDAMSIAAEIAAAVGALSARAERQRAEFVAVAMAQYDAAACPICMEALSDPLACPNQHSFCSSCLRRMHQHRKTPFVCPLCRIALSPDIFSRENGGDIFLREG